jgi:2-methylisocitrate lyase-like PEP mutase family enzyme
VPSLETRRTRAEQFRRLHDEVLLLPNAWDPPSAHALAEAGAPAIATTSAGIAWSRGVPDAGGLTLEVALDAFTRIAQTVDLPVSGDIERGYAEDAAEIAANAALFVDAGAAGLNLEDSVRRAVVPLADQVAVLAAVRSAIDATGVPAYLNARVDVFLFVEGPRSQDDLLAEAVERARAYHAAGADGVFVPGLGDRDLVRTLCSTLDLPVNTGPLTTDRAELAALGIRRVTWGPGLAMSAYGATRERVRALLDGDTPPGTADRTPRLNLAEKWPA